MQPVFNALFICLFICINRTVNGAILWPGIFAQTGALLRQPSVFWPPPTFHSSGELTTANLQQSESHLLGSAEHHMISSEEPIPSGLFIPVDQLQRELFNSPRPLRKHSSNHYPSYHQFNQYPPHSKKSHTSAKHPASKSFNKHFHNRKKPPPPKDEFVNDKFSYLDDFYAKQTDLFNFNKLTGNLFGEYGDYSPEQLKNWKIRSNEQTNTIASSEEQPYEDDLFTIKNGDQTYRKPKHQMTGGDSNGRIDLRKASNKRKQLKDHLKLREYRNRDVKEYRDEDMKEYKSELNEMRGKEANEEQKETNENRYLDNYDNRNNVAGTSTTDKKYTENRNIERYNLENFFNNEKLSQLMRNDGRILIGNQNTNQNNQADRNEHSLFTDYKKPNGELSVISETIYQNHQLKNDNRRSPSRLVLMQNYDHQFDSTDLEKQHNESVTILTNSLSSNQNETDNQPSADQLPTDATKLSDEKQANQVYGTTWNAQRIIPTPQISFMQTVFTESNTLSTNDQSTKPTNYLSERSQLNQNSNHHFSTLAISAIIIASLIAALLFTGSSLFLMYKVSQIKKRRLMRFQETTNRNQFEAAFPVQATSCNTPPRAPSLEANATLSSNIISNNNFIRQQKSLFSNLNSRCNAGKSMLQIDPNSNFTIKSSKPNKTATINKKLGKHLSLANGECYVTQMKTSSNEKNSALSRLISKMSNQANQTDTIRTDQPPTNQDTQRVSFF